MCSAPESKSTYRAPNLLQRAGASPGRRFAQVLTEGVRVVYYRLVRHVELPPILCDFLHKVPSLPPLGLK